MDFIPQIYSIGYSGIPPADILAYAKSVNALVVDTRISPRSRNPVYTRKRLTELMGERYQHIRNFGNQNFKGGEIMIQDFDAGLAEVRADLESRPVMLMCVCSSHTTCHRNVVIEMLLSHYPQATVTHLSKHDVRDTLYPSQLKLF